MMKPPSLCLRKEKSGAPTAISVGPSIGCVRSTEQVKAKVGNATPRLPKKRRDHIPPASNT
jgi:hypothetical protein